MRLMKRYCSRVVALAVVLTLMLVPASSSAAVATASWNQEMVTWAKIAFAFSLDP